ncbi:YdgA family protein [Kingella potus]|nr:YdgA family protein [Kingella potus]
MKKKTIAGLSAAALAAALSGGMPYYFGGKAEKVLDGQYRLLQENSIVHVESRSYERGWFSSTETLVVRVKPSLLNNAANYLPDNLKTVLSEPVTVVNSIRHGPFAGGFAAARVQSEFRYAPESEKVLKRFFGDRVPITLTNTIGFDGAGRLNLDIPAFDYEELSGIALNWKGLSGQTDYAAGWKSFKSGYTAPFLHVKLADKGDIVLEDLQIGSDTHEGAGALALGSSNFKLGRLSLQWQQGIDYNIRLNELANLVTDLQIGAFINPTGTIPPSKITVEKLSFDTRMNEENGWANSEGRFRFDKLAYGDDNYGPLDISVAAEHLHTESLLAFKNKLAELAAKNMSEEEIRAALLDTARNEASGLFTGNPQIKLRAFDFTLPQGKIHADGEIVFNGLTRSDLDDIASILKKTQADFKFSIPEPLLESIAVSRARSLFTVNPEDEAEGTADIEDIHETLRAMVRSTVNSMAADGYLKLDDDDISTRIQLAGGKLTMNGKVLESEPDFYDEEAYGEETGEADAEAQPAETADAAEAEQAAPQSR